MPTTKGTRRRRKAAGPTPVLPGRKLRLMTHAERVDAVRGTFAYVRTSVDQFLGRKHAEFEMEDRK
jgi:hypothetical protein